MKASIPRTATLAWSPAKLDSVAQPYIATATVAGALDDSFSDESVLEIWQPSYTGESEKLDPVASISTGARFNRLTWGHVHSSRPKGVLAGGFENGELALWDADKLLSKSSGAEILRNNQHSGPVRGLDFNKVQTNLLASGGTNGEIFIWDLNSPGKPYSPGQRSNKLDEITALSWNAKVPQILATASNSGTTVVWDLKGKREVAALSYGGAGAGTNMANMGMNGFGGASSGRRGVGAVCWHPEQPTRLVTSSEDDNNPVIMVWNLRNALAPELVLTGHSKGILSMSWCRQDEDLLVSCGKDNRTILWNPQSGEIVGELPSSSNWTFDVQWCPRNPDLLATASFDGKIGVHSLQATNANEGAAAQAAAAAAAAQQQGGDADFFNNMPTAPSGSPGVSLKQPPKWLRRPVSATFAFGGQLVSVSNLAGPSGKTQSSVVHIRDVVTEPTIVERAQRLQQALAQQDLASFCDEKSQSVPAGSGDATNWKALQTLFKADSRDELVTLLGFSKEDVAAKVAAAVASFKEKSGHANIETAAEAEAKAAKEAAKVAAVEEKVAEESAKTPTEATAATDASSVTAETGAEEPSLFGTEPESAASDAFFGEIAQKSALPSHLTAGTGAGTPTAASVAATAGSPVPSRAPSASLRASTFRIYPKNETESDKLITRALVLGDFESAVSLCISADKFADAILLAVRGGEDLLAKTQKLYFEQRTASTPYLRLYQSIVSDDLSDIVQNADLTEWQEIFVVLCTFARSDEFGNLTEQLGQRLEAQYIQAKSTEARKNAILVYLAAGKLEKVVNMWIDEMKEEEEALVKAQESASAPSGSYSAHAEALQTFIEKVIVFQHAVGYVDMDLQQPTGDAYVAENGLRVYKLSALYDRIHEYVDLLADQGLISPALSFIQQTPSDYKGAKASANSTSDDVASLARDRLSRAQAARPSERAQPGATASIAPVASTSSAVASTSQSNGYNPYAPVQQPAAAVAPAVPSVPAVQSDPYAATQPYGQPYGQQAAQPQAYDPYGSSAAYGAPAYAPPVPQPMIPPPGPTLTNTQPSMDAGLAPPPPPKRDNTGWNDVPETAAAPRRTTSAMGNKAAPITSPFPNAPAPAPYGGQPSGPPPGPPQGPPRGQTPGRQAFGSPPPGAPAGLASYGPRANVPVGPPPPGRQGPPPPPQGPPRGPGGPPTGPPGVAQQQRPPQAQFPPQQQQAPQQQQPGPYAPQQPPQQQQPGPYGPPQPQQPPTGPYAPPPGAAQNGMRPPIPQQQPNLPQPPAPAPPRMGTPGVATGPPAGSGAGAPPRSQTPAKPAQQSKYPPGDRSHIPESSKPIFNVLSQALNQFKGSGAPKRMVDDVEARVNLLFDALNCETVDPKTIQGLHQLCQAIAARNINAALDIHLRLATTATGDMSRAFVGIKQLITKLR